MTREKTQEEKKNKSSDELIGLQKSIFNELRVNQFTIAIDKHHE